MVSTLENDDLRNNGENPEDAVPQWYILKCQVNREDRCKRELERRVRISGLEKYIPEVAVPVENVMQMTKNGQQRAKREKKFPGYILVKMVLNDETWFLMRETPGVGDFTGASGKPMPMNQEEVERILNIGAEKKDAKPKMAVPYSVGEVIRIIDGSFKDLEGEVTKIDYETGRVTVSIKMFGNPAHMELEYWQTEKITVEN